MRRARGRAQPLSSAPREHTRSTIAKKCGCSIGSPAENDRDGTSLSMSSSMTANTPFELVAEGLARTALLDAVQAGEGALVRDLPRDVERRAQVLRLAGTERPADREVSAATPAARSATPSAIEEPALAQLGDEGADFALDHCVATGEAVGEPRRDRILVASHRDLP